MCLFVQLVDPEILVNLDDREIDALEAVVEAEIYANPKIQEALRTRVDPLTASISAVCREINSNAEIREALRPKVERVVPEIQKKIARRQAQTGAAGA